MSPSDKLDCIFEDRIQAFGTRYRYYRVAAHRFLAYLEKDFPNVHQLSDLRRDPHLLGWIHDLCEEEPLASYTRRIYLTALRRLLKDLASEGHTFEAGLIHPLDFPPRPPHVPRWVLKKDRQSQQQIRHKYAPRSQPHPVFQPIFEVHIQTLAATLRPHTVHIHQVSARRFLSYLYKEFPQIVQLSELRRDPHLLGWVSNLCSQDPPLTPDTCQTYLYTLRHLFQILIAGGHPLQPALILPEDIPQRRQPPRRRKKRRPELPRSVFQEIFDARIQTLATTLRPSTIVGYRSTVRHFLNYLQSEFPQLSQLSELRRDPHLLGWLRRLCDQTPPLSNTTRQAYLLDLRRLLDDLMAEGHLLPPGLIVSSDLPPTPKHLPRLLSPELDQQIQEELRRTDDLFSNALLLTRATGMRIGECVHLSLDCLRSLGLDQWAVHVPLGKLYTERLVPADENIRQIIARILSLRAEAPASHQDNAKGFLLPRPGSFAFLYHHLRQALHGAAGRIGCHERITPHRLRHTFASEMIRLGVSLPGLMQLLGHKDIRMTMRYVQVTQRDLQREFYSARRNAVHQHRIPELPMTRPLPTKADLSSILRTVAAARYLLEMYRRQLQDERSRRKLHRLDKRLRNVAGELDHFITPEK
jgi:site-specific recombinase XerD